MQKLKNVNAIFKDFNIKPVNTQQTVISANNIKYKEITLADILTLFIEYNIPVANETIEELKKHLIYYIKQ